MNIKNPSIALTVFILLTLAAISCASSLIPAHQPLTSEIWFDDLKDGFEIFEQEGNVLVQSIAESLYSDKTSLRNIPPDFQDDASPRIVFLSVSDGNTPAFVALGRGNGLINALDHAFFNLRKTLPEEYRPQWVKLDIVKKVHPSESVNPSTQLDFERSLNGIALKRGTGLAFLPEELVANTLVDSNQRLRSENITKYLEAQPIKADIFDSLTNQAPFEITRFTPDSYFYDGRDAFRLYRGHRMFDETFPELLIQSAKSGGDYLKRSVHPDGSFVYIYRPKTDEASEAYNILRHAGSIYSMLELYQVTGDPELLQSSKRAIDYLIKSIKPCQIGSETLACVVEESNVKLGGNALSVVALAIYIGITNEREYMPTVLRLARWIQRSQKESGEFFPHKQSYPGGEASPFVSQYYPGEAILALMRIYELNGDESFLDSAERGAQYLINVRDKSLSDSELNHDHWLLYGLNELYRYKPNPLYLNHSMRITKAMIRSQNRDPKYPDWFGSYYRPPRSTPTATRSEGLYAAYQLAHDFGDPNEAEQILESLENGIRFQLQTQFRPESVLYLKKPQRALGGFHSSLTNFEIRNDYVQHNISSILGLYRIQRNMGKNEEFPVEEKSKINLLKILFVTEREFKECYRLLLDKSGNPREFKKVVRTGRDDIGPYMEIML